MTAANVVGWVAVCVGMVVALPQLVRLARTRKVDGLSLTSWRSILAMNIAWAAHFPNEAPMPPPALANVAP